MSGATHRIGDIAFQVRGVTYQKQDALTVKANGYLPILRAGNITDYGLIFDDLVYVPASKISSKQMVKKNDILIATSSGSIDVVGKAARVLEDFEGGFGAFCKILRPFKDVDAAYFAHFFKTSDYRRTIHFLLPEPTLITLEMRILMDSKSLSHLSKNKNASQKSLTQQTPYGQNAASLLPSLMP